VNTVFPTFAVLYLSFQNFATPISNLFDRV
jgi:hypothetical protein